MLGQGGFSGVIVGQATRPAHQRIVTTQGDTVVCKDQPMITQAYYTFRVELQTHKVAVEHDPHQGAIARTRQTKAPP